MPGKPHKRIILVLAAILGGFVIIMSLPRLIAAVSPGSLPVGYHFVALDYLAVACGLEKIVNLEAQTPSGIEEIRGIEYKNADGHSLQLDIYRPFERKEALPLLVFIHGGGWKSGIRDDYRIYLIPFAQMGYITATVSYRLLDVAPYPASALDIRDALQWFKDHGTDYGYDTARIAVVGGSAGAHLAMLAAYGWQRPDTVDGSTPGIALRNPVKAVVDIYGPVDLTTEYARNHPLVTGYLANSFKEAPETYREASPLTWLDSHDPPTLILHGSSDDLVPVSQARLLKDKLDSLGVDAELNVLPLWPHTMDIVKRVNTFTKEKMHNFFLKYL